jgi:hypothetical protein
MMVEDHTLADCVVHVDVGLFRDRNCLEADGLLEYIDPENLGRVFRSEAGACLDCLVQVDAALFPDRSWFEAAAVPT